MIPAFNNIPATPKNTKRNNNQQQNTMKKALFALVLTLSAYTTFAQITKADHNTRTDFSKLNAYCLIEGKIIHYLDGVPSQQKMINRYIDSTLTAGLNAKGFKKASSMNDLDFVITYTVGVKSETELENTEGNIARQFGYHAPYSKHHHHWYQESSAHWWQTVKPTYTLVVDVYDGKTKQLIWRCHTEHIIRGKANNHYIALSAQKAIQEFPGHK